MPQGQFGRIVPGPQGSCLVQGLQAVSILLSIGPALGLFCSEKFFSYAAECRRVFEQLWQDLHKFMSLCCQNPLAENPFYVLPEMRAFMGKGKTVSGFLEDSAKDVGSKLVETDASGRVLHIRRLLLLLLFFCQIDLVCY